jgi:hypothetical protein
MRTIIKNQVKEGTMQHVAAVSTVGDASVRIGFDPGNLEVLVHNGRVDTYIVAAEDGFSPLGRNMDFLSNDLGVPRSELARLASWVRNECQSVALIAVPSRNPAGSLRGVILAASETSNSYAAFAEPMFGKPYRDFYYNVTYEAIAFAAKHWNASSIAISHLSASGRFDADIAKCNAEALTHFCRDIPSAVEFFVFLGCCIEAGHLDGIPELVASSLGEAHRPLVIQVVPEADHVLIYLDLPPAVQPGAQASRQTPL